MKIERATSRAEVRTSADILAELKRQPIKRKAAMGVDPLRRQKQQLAEVERSIKKGKQ